MSKAVDEAAKFLRELLAAGPMTSNDVQARSEAAGLAWAAIRRAKSQARVMSRKSKTGTWHWSLRDYAQKVQGAVRQDEQKTPPTVEDAHEAQALPCERVIIVLPPGIKISARDQILWDRWIEVGKDNTRLLEYVHERDAFVRKHLPEAAR